MRHLCKSTPSSRTAAKNTHNLLAKHLTTIPKMSDTATNQNQNQDVAAAKDARPQQSTAENTSVDEAGNDAKSSSATAQEQGQEQEQKEEQPQQTGPGPKVLRSHYRGMPNQWEKNRSK